MKSFRLTPLVIFLIILAVLLIGYVLMHIWKNCQAPVTEGFSTEDGIRLAGYSMTGGTKVIPLVPDLLYFDPVNRSLVNKPAGNMLYIKSKGGADISFNLGFNGSYNVVDGGFGDISYNTGNTPVGTAVTLTSNATIATAKNYFMTLSGDSTIFMDVDLSSAQVTSGIVTDATQITSARTYSDSNQRISDTNDRYPILKAPATTDYRKRRFYRTTNAFNVANITTGDPVKYTFTTMVDNRYGVVHIPVASTSVSFLHIIDLAYKQHAETFYFNSATLQMESLRLGRDIFDKTVTIVPASLSEVNGTSVTPLPVVTQDDVDFVVQLKYDETSKTIHVMGSKKEEVERTQFYVILSFQSNTKFAINFSSTKIGDATFTSDVSQNTTEMDSLYKTLEKMKLLKDFFSSPDNDYLLKTEVVPPVCPSCPSCSTGGVCSDCGGKGGSGTNSSDSKLSSNELAKEFGTGASSLLRDGAKGTTDLIRDAAGGVTNVAKDSIGGVGNFAKDSASGIGNFAKDSASGVGNFAKDVAGGAALGTAVAVGGAYGIGRDAVGGAYNAASGAVSGTVGLGREIVSGAAGMLNNGQGGQGQGQYQGQGQGQGQGPNTSMGGYQNSYGGQNSYQPPATAGQDPYSYFGAVPSRAGSSNYMPRTADFSHFGK